MFFLIKRVEFLNFECFIDFLVLNNDINKPKNCRGQTNELIKNNCRASRRCDSNIFHYSGDKNRNIREKGFGIVMNIRASEAWMKHVERESGSRRPKRIRHYHCPKINFNCSSYIEMFRLKAQVRALI